MNKQTSEQVVHDLLVEKVQKLVSKKGSLTYDLARAEVEIEFQYKVLRQWEDEHNLPRRM